MPDAMAADDSAVLWDVVEEHLNELEFCLEQFERTLDDCVLTLDQLGRGIEPRFAAHLDALVVGGEPVLQRLLVPAVEELDPEEPARASAVAAALTAIGAYDVLAGALSHAEPAVRRAAVRGAVLVGNAHLSEWALQRSKVAKEATLRAALLDLLAGQGVEAPSIAESLRSGEPVLVAAAARAARIADIATFLPILEGLVESSDRDVRDAALTAALACGSMNALYACERAAFDASQVDPVAMILCASLGSPAVLARMAELSQKKTHRLPALFALGCSGDPSQVPFLLQVVASNDELDAKVAAQAISTITGLDLGDETFSEPAAEPKESAAEDDDTEVVPPLDEEPENLVPVPEEALPKPNSDAFARFWAAVSPQFASPGRYIGGRPFDADTALEYLKRAPLRRRHAVALAVGIRSGGRARIDTRAMSAAQQARLSSACALDSRTLFRHWVGW